MYKATSEAYKLTAKKNSRQEFIRGQVGGYNFNSENLLSLSYTNQASDSTDLTLGAVYIGQLEAEFVNIGIPRGQWNQKEIRLEYGLALQSSVVVLEDTQGLEFIPAGRYTIASAKWNKDVVRVTAYDNMSKLDKALTVNSINGSIYELAQYICSECGVVLANTQEDIEAMPNGVETFGLNPENELKTYRDMLSRLAQLVGGFATATRDGKIQIISFENVEVVDTIGADSRLQDSTFSDFVAKYIGIQMLDRTTGSTIDVTNGNTSGRFISIGDNPFLTYGLEETKERQRTNIARAIKEFQYTPFTTSVLTNPAYDLADVIEFTGGTAGDTPARGCILSNSWTFHSTSDLEGFGADPNLSEGISKAEKTANAAASQVRGESLTFFTYANASSIAIGEEPTRISKITFVNAKETNIETWTQAQIKTILDVDLEYMEVKATMVLDGETIIFEPVERYNDSGLHLFHLLWVEMLNDMTSHTWEVYLQASGGTIEIEADGLRTVIKGQGISTSRDWDGFIDIEESIPTIRNGLDVADEFSEDEQIDLFVPVEANATDDVLPISSILETDSISDDLTILLEIAVYDLITEEGENFITEDGDTLQALGG